MKKQITFLLIAISVFASCTRISFLYPVSESGKNKIFKSELIGEWKDNDDENTKIIIDTTMNSDSTAVYSITIIDTSKHSFADTSYLSGELFNLQNKIFMSVYTDFDNKKYQAIGIYNAAMMLPSYQVIRLYKITPDSIQFGQINGDTLIHLMNTKKIVLKNEMIEKGDMLILEKSGSLQKKLIELEKFPNLYEKVTLHRVK